MTDYNNAIVEFTEQISFKEPVDEDDFEITIRSSNGTYQEVSFVIPSDAQEYYLPSKTVVFQIYQENMTELSQDTHS